MYSADGDARIKSFVFLDLETTGLENDCRITEICLCSVSRPALLEPPILNKPPRVLDKMMMCFDPARVVNPRAAQMTGLSQELLQRNQRSVFSVRAAESLKSFLQLQASPVCLVAHNGYKFDFRITANHFKDVGVELPSNMGILCACTLSAFRDLKPVPLNHTLATLYERHVGDIAPNAHTAEGDCMSLLQLVHHTSDETLPWIDENARCFTHEGPGVGPLLPSETAFFQRRRRRTSDSLAGMSTLKRARSQPHAAKDR